MDPKDFLLHGKAISKPLQERRYPGVGLILTLCMCHLPPGPICISVHLQPEASKPKVLRSISNNIKRELRGPSTEAWEEPGQGAWLSALLKSGLAWEDGNPDQKGSPWLHWVPLTSPSIHRAPAPPCLSSQPCRQLLSSTVQGQARVNSPICQVLGVKFERATCSRSVFKQQLVFIEY